MSDEPALWIDGKPYRFSDLTLAEEIQLAELVLSVAPLNEDGEPDTTLTVDAHRLAAFVTVVKRRENPSFELGEALTMKRSDLGEPARPTRARKKTS